MTLVRANPWTTVVSMFSSSSDGGAFREIYRNAFPTQPFRSNIGNNLADRLIPTHLKTTKFMKKIVGMNVKIRILCYILSLFYFVKLLYNLAFDLQSLLRTVEQCL